MKSKIIVFLLLITTIVGCGTNSDKKDEAPLVESRRAITLCPSLLDPYMILSHHTAPDILGD